jgi:hypothetical protein
MWHNIGELRLNTYRLHVLEGEQTMRRLLPLVVILILFLLVGCARSAPVPGSAGEATSTPLIEPTAAVQELPETLLIFTREGGIAGFCDTLTVHADDASLEHCGGQSSLITLDEQTRAELEALARRYAPTVVGGEDNPGGPDSLKQVLDFRGIGSEEPTEEVLDALRAIASNLITQAD